MHKEGMESEPMNKSNESWKMGAVSMGLLIVLGIVLLWPHI